MAEIALIASIVQVADVGLRLSLGLYAFGETVASADRSILAISKDVSLTSSILKELGQTLKEDVRRIHSDNAARMIKDTVRECSEVFQEMDGILLKKMPILRSGIGDERSRARTMLEHLRWPTIRGKIELLQKNLDRMKSNLNLLLQVVAFGSKVSRNKKNVSIEALAEHQQLIESLARANEQRKSEYEELRRAVNKQGRHNTLGAQNDPKTSLTTAALGAAGLDTGRGLDLENESGVGGRKLPHGPAVNSQEDALEGGPIAELDAPRRRRKKRSAKHKSNPVQPIKDARAPQVLRSERELKLLLDEVVKLRRQLKREIYSEEYRIEPGTRSSFAKWVKSAERAETRRAASTLHRMQSSGHSRSHRTRSRSSAYTEDVSLQDNSRARERLSSSHSNSEVIEVARARERSASRWISRGPPSRESSRRETVVIEERRRGPAPIPDDYVEVIEDDSPPPRRARSHRIDDHKRTTEPCKDTDPVSNVPTVAELLSAWTTVTMP